MQGTPGYIPQIDSLRAFAVLAVLIFHLNGAWLPGGFAGVDVFFVISGYVVSASLVRSRAITFGRFALNFYAKRILRIVPALLACLIVTAIFTVAFVPSSWLSQSNYTTLLLAFMGLSNFSLMNAGDSYFAPRIDFNPATHTWSLGVEEQFYLIFPALYFLWLRGQRGHVTPLSRWSLPAVVIVSMAYSAYSSFHAPLQAYYSLPSRFWELGCGALLFQLHHSGRYIATSSRWSVCLVAALAALVIAVVFSNEALFPFPWGIAAVVGSTLFIDAVVARAQDVPNAAMRWLAAPLAVGIGKISYSLYLWHWPVYVLFRWTVGLETAPPKIVAVILVFALAFASYRFLEVPIRHHAGILRRPAGFAIAGGLGCVALSVALGVGLTKAQPHLTLSVTRNAHDWYSTPWPLAEPQTQATCKTHASWRALGSGGGVHEFVHDDCGARPRRRVFVTGDSHAGALMTMLGKLAASEQVDVYLYTRSNCSFLRIRAANHTPRCAEFARVFTEELKQRARPGDVVFLASLRVERLANQWGGLLKPQLLSATEIAHRRAEGIAEAETWIQEIAPLQLRLVFMGPTPVFAAPAFRCSDWFNRDNPICAPGLQIERARLEQLREPALTGIAELAARHANVSIWDPLDLLCSPTVCSAFRDGRPVFFDGDHLSSFGNLLLYDSFHSMIIAPQLAGAAAHSAALQ